MPMTKTQLTTHLGVGRAVIDRLVAEGLPGTADAKTGRLTFDAAEVARWLLAKAEAAAGGPDAERERTRLLRAQADLAEHRLARERGEYLQRDDVRRAWETIFRNIRDLLRQLPMAIVDGVMAASEDGRPAVYALLRHEIDDALTRASTLPVDGGDPADDDDEADDA